MLVALLITLAASLNYLVLSGMLPSSALLVRGVIHIALLVAWCISIRTRIIHVQVRRFLLVIAAMMMLWLLLKIVKHSISGIDVKRWLWYWYYFPMLFIPTVSLFTSMLLGKAENYRLSRWTKLLYVFPAVLLLCVLTNDLHQRVFSFPSGIMTDIYYRYEMGYYLILGWIILCALASFIVMLSKCRVHRNKKFLLLPLVPLGLSLAYTLVYIGGVKLVLLLAGDMTVVQCLLIVVVFEACIRCGLIQSNTGYAELLKATTLPVQITDQNFSVRHASAAMSEHLPKLVLQQIQTASTPLNNTTLLKRYPLRHGWVFWKEDVSELTQLQEELTITRDELRETGNVLAAENEQREKRLRISEETRLYDAIEEQTSQQIVLLQHFLAEIQASNNPASARKLLGHTIVVGTYIKRRSSLIFAAAHSEWVSVYELQLCLNESVESLNLCGVPCSVRIQGEGLLATTQAMQLYDLFEAVVEAGIQSIESLFLFVEVSHVITVNMVVSSTTCLSAVCARVSALKWSQDEDNLQYFTCSMENAGNFALQSSEDTGKVTIYNVHEQEARTPQTNMLQTNPQEISTQDACAQKVNEYGSN